MVGGEGVGNVRDFEGDIDPEGPGQGPDVEAIESARLDTHQDLAGAHLPALDHVAGIEVHHPDLGAGHDVIPDLVRTPDGGEGSWVARDLGLRHRAAIGLTERTDAFVIITSEETGAISIAENGRLDYGLSIGEVETRLNTAFAPDAARSEE